MTDTAEDHAAYRAEREARLHRDPQPCAAFARSGSLAPHICDVCLWPQDRHQIGRAHV